MLIVLTTVSNCEEGEDLAHKIVAANLAACVQILPAIKSVYFWEDSVKTDTENLLLIKTLPEKFAELENFITEHHSYDVPEIVALSADKVSAQYFGWIKNYLG